MSNGLKVFLCILIGGFVFGVLCFLADYQKERKILEIRQTLIDSGFTPCPVSYKEEAKMALTEWDVCLIARFDYIKWALIGLVIPSSLALFIFCIIFLITLSEEESKKLIRSHPVIFGSLFLFWLTSVILLAVLPNSKEYAAIKLIPQGINMETARQKLLPEDLRLRYEAACCSFFNKYYAEDGMKFGPSDDIISKPANEPVEVKSAK